MSSKRIAILQPAYLPWLGYFELLDAVDLFVDYDDVQFTRRDWRSRNRVLGSNGAVWLSVPTCSRVGEASSVRSPIHQIQIDYSSKWVGKHLRTLRESYSSAPYFTCFYPRLESIYAQRPSALKDLDSALRDTIAKWLGIDTPVISSSRLDAPSNKGERILNICQLLKADSYYSGAAARDYLEPAVFQAAGVRISFQNYQHPQYRQQGSAEFISHLSVLDLLFNEGPQSLEVIRSGRSYSQAY